MAKKWTVFALLLTLLFSLAACGSKDPAPTSAASPEILELGSQALAAMNTFLEDPSDCTVLLQELEPLMEKIQQECQNLDQQAAEQDGADARLESLIASAQNVSYYVSAFSAAAQGSNLEMCREMQQALAALVAPVPQEAAEAPQGTTAPSL